MIDLVHKLPELDQKLITLLEGLDKEDWDKQTIAKRWRVKDVVAHLLDGNIRVLSGLRDNHKADVPAIHSYQDLLDYLNRLNAEWVMAMKRVSPEILLDMLKHTSDPYYKYYASLDPLARAEYPVAWAGETESTNWMHIAREYTEKFLHQQQIRDAVGQPGIINQAFYGPFLEVCLLALPHTLRNTPTQSGNVVTLEITGEVTGQWAVQFNGHHWEAVPFDSGFMAVSTITLDGYSAWKLFSKSLRPHDLIEKINIKGDQKLGKAAVELVSFMA